MKIINLNLQDTISKRLDTNHEALSCLVQKVDNRSAPFDSTQNALEQLVSSLKDQLSNFLLSVSSLRSHCLRRLLNL